MLLALKPYISFDIRVSFPEFLTHKIHSNGKKAFGFLGHIAVGLCKEPLVRPRVCDSGVRVSTWGPRGIHLGPVYWS